MSETLLSISDLSVAFGLGERQVLAVDKVSFDIGKGRQWAWSANPAPAKPPTALSVMKLLPYRSAHHPSGSIRFKGEELLPMRENDPIRLAHKSTVKGSDAPMTSLNPWVVSPDSSSATRPVW